MDRFDGWTTRRHPFTKRFPAMAIVALALLMASCGSDSSGSGGTTVADPSGSLDTTFGTDGMVTTDIGAGNDLLRAVALQPDGKIVAAGYKTTMGGAADFALVRYWP